jgi:hypothetical protein
MRAIPSWLQEASMTDFVLPMTEREGRLESPFVDIEAALTEGAIVEYRGGKYFYRFSKSDFPIGISVFRQKEDIVSVGGIIYSSATYPAGIGKAVEIYTISVKEQQKGIGTVLKSLAKTHLRIRGNERTVGTMSMYEPKVVGGEFNLGAMNGDGLGTFLSGKRAVNVAVTGDMNGPCFLASISKIALVSHTVNETGKTVYELAVDLTTDLTSHIDQRRIELNSKGEIAGYFRRLLLPAPQEFMRNAERLRGKDCVFREMVIPLI